MFTCNRIPKENQKALSHLLPAHRKLGALVTVGIFSTITLFFAVIYFPSPPPIRRPRVYPDPSLFERSRSQFAHSPSPYYQSTASQFEPPPSAQPPPPSQVSQRPNQVYSQPMRGQANAIKRKGGQSGGARRRRRRRIKTDEEVMCERP